MRQWRYSYKTSDGLKHESEIFASDKDSAYGELRQRGIRPIRVEEIVRPIVKKGLKGLRRRDWGILSAVVVAVAVVGGWLLSLYRPNFEVDQSSTDAVAQIAAMKSGASDAFGQLMSDVAKALEEYQKGSDAIDRELLANYALVERQDDLSEFQQEIAKGRDLVEASRQNVRKVFAQWYTQLSPSNELELVQAQRVYGMAMESIDSTEEQLDADECALEMLNSNRGAWHVRKGEVIWDDVQLETIFRMYSRKDVAGTLRWQKDFGVVQGAVQTRDEKK